MIPLEGSECIVAKNNKTNQRWRLYEQWVRKMRDAGIDKEDVVKNSDAVLDVLKFNDRLNKAHGDTQAMHNNVNSANDASTSSSAAGGNDMGGNGNGQGGYAALPSSSDPPVSLRDLCNPGRATDLYSNFQKIGEGAAGEVFLATQNSTGVQVAIKKMPINSENMKLLCTEISIMKTSIHANIVQYYDAFIVEQNQIWVSYFLFCYYKNIHFLKLNIFESIIFMEESIECIKQKIVRKYVVILCRRVKELFLCLLQSRDYFFFLKMSHNSFFACLGAGSSSEKLNERT